MSRMRGINCAIYSHPTYEELKPKFNAKPHAHIQNSHPTYEELKLKRVFPSGIPCLIHILPMRN